MAVNYKFAVFDQANPAPAADLAALHAVLLPRSPLTKLGQRFMERFYYKVFPREGLIFGAMAYVDGCPAGFIAATNDSNGFMPKMIRCHWFRVVWTLAVSIALSPNRFAPVWEALSIMLSRKPADPPGPDGEILSLGVLPEYRAAEFRDGTGLALAADLMDYAVKRLREMGASEIRVIVDDDNKVAQLFYHGLGWDLVRGSVPGWKTPSVEFVLRPKP
jgi:ribosomal protein S18 acetylase RimI-like enzyme